MPHPANKPSAAKAALSIALPVRNVGTVIEKSVTAWIHFLDKLHRPYEFFIVADGSTDDTVAKAHALAARYPQIQLLEPASPAGFGAALRQALARAQHPLFFYASLDYPYLPHELQKLLDRIDEVDIVCGFRAAQPLPRWVRISRAAVNIVLRMLIGLHRDQLPGWLGGAAHWYSWLVRTVFGVQIIDVDCAFKLFRRDIFARIPIQSNGDFVHTEILSKANFLTCWMDEVPLGASDKHAQVNFHWNQRGKDMWRVLNGADFGPAVLPPPTPVATPT